MYKQYLKDNPDAQLSDINKPLKTHSVLPDSYLAGNKKKRYYTKLRGMIILNI